MSTGKEAGVWAYSGLFMVTLATLMYEILLTRIFSVTMWYHFAFMAISLAMFGMSVGAIWVYLRAGEFNSAVTHREMARSSLLFAVWAVVAFLIHMVIPFRPGPSVDGAASMAFTYTVFCVPFAFSGVCVCLALTKFPSQVSKLYAADLAGASSGCIVLIYALRIGDGPTTVILVAFFASVAAVFFSTQAGFRELRRVATVACLAFATFVVVNTFLASRQRPLLRLAQVKGDWETPPVYEKWNSFSRIAVRDDPERRETPFGWGLSPTYSSRRKPWQLFLRIDGNAETVLTAFNGDCDAVDYLKYDVTNLVHYIRPDSRVLVVGAGGGRDVLSALAFGQKSVVAVEMNEDILAAVNKRFGNFTGHLDRNPKVSFVNEEARSYVARSKCRFDIIQISFTDTWSATAAGAFVLAENSLYTMEAWLLFLEHLPPSGVLSVSRWYFRDLPGEMYRLTSLSSAALIRRGTDHPEKHIVIVKCMSRLSSLGIRNVPNGIGTILVSKEPFSDKDLDTIEGIGRKMGFKLVLSPRPSGHDSVFSALADGRGPDRLGKTFPIKVTPPTDDRPFFFNLIRFRDALKPARWNQGKSSFNLQAVFVLGSLLLIVTGLSGLTIILPLVLTTRKETLNGATPHLLYFAAIGLGFMLVEVSQMERLIIFLGHPTYGLSVVLFSLLLSAGLGSYSTQKVSNLTSLRAAAGLLLLLLAALMIFGIATPHAIHAFSASTTVKRILTAAGILFPLGLTMGLAFPLGLKLASHQSSSLTPWLWGINGAASVCASVLGVAIALSAGIRVAYWTGFASYVVAWAAFAWASSGTAEEPSSVYRVTRMGVGNMLP